MFQLLERKGEQSERMKSETSLRRKFSDHVSVVVKSVMSPLWGRRDQHVCVWVCKTLKPPPVFVITVTFSVMKPQIWPPPSPKSTNVLTTVSWNSSRLQSVYDVQISVFICIYFKCFIINTHWTSVDLTCSVLFSHCFKWRQLLIIASSMKRWGPYNTRTKKKKNKMLFIYNLCNSNMYTSVVL